MHLCGPPGYAWYIIATIPGGGSCGGPLPAEALARRGGCGGGLPCAAGGGLPAGRCRGARAPSVAPQLLQNFLSAVLSSTTARTKHRYSPVFLGRGMQIKYDIFPRLSKAFYRPLPIFIALDCSCASLFSFIQATERPTFKPSFFLL